MSAMKTSPKGIALIQEFETLELEAYPDPGTGGEPWTIGWGSTHVWENGRKCGAVRPGMSIDEATADQWFEWELAQFESDVRSLVTTEIMQEQFDALVSFAYNCGSDIDRDNIAEGLGDSTLLRKVNRRDFAGAAAEFEKWNKAGGRVMRGLTRRRKAERALFESCSKENV